MDPDIAKEAIRLLFSIKNKLESIPPELRGDLLLECKLLEDKIRDKFYRSRRR